MEEVVQAAVEGGADVIQLRDKKAEDEKFLQTAKALLKITRPRGIPLIVNDRIRVAKKAGADGVHLGQEDGSLKEARALLGENAILGRSTHSRAQALEAEKEGFDYIGVGPIFETPTKPGRPAVGLDLVRFASENISIPFVAIGGIHAANIEEVKNAGAKTVAVVRALMQSHDPRQTARRLVRFLRRSGNA